MSERPVGSALEGSRVGCVEAIERTNPTEVTAMTDTRLRFLSADLADRVKNSPAEKRRQAVLAACSQAIEHSALTDPIALSTLSRLRAGDEIDHLSRLRLDRLVDAWDEEAWKEVDNTHTGDLAVQPQGLTKHGRPMRLSMRCSMSRAARIPGWQRPKLFMKHWCAWTTTPRMTSLRGSSIKYYCKPRRHSTSRRDIN